MSCRRLLLVLASVTIQVANPWALEPWAAGKGTHPATSATRNQTESPPPPAASQKEQKDQDDPIRLKTDLVPVNVSIVDRGGRAVRSLTAKDFVIHEDGVKQKIGHFTPTEGPFSLMLLLDVSGSTSGDVALMKQAARNFLAEMGPDDQAGLIMFSGDVDLLGDLGEPGARLASALGEVESPLDPGPHRFTQKSGTSFYDALYLAVEETGLKRAEGRKAIVCMSDGVDSTSKLGYREVSRAVEGSGASVYFLELNTEEKTLAGLLKRRTDPGFINFSQSQLKRYFETYDPESLDRLRPREALSAETLTRINEALYGLARRELRESSERTGGHVYPVRTLSNLNGVYKQVADDLRAQYVIGYYPSNDARDGRWRTIKVDVARPGATVRARSGYWAAGPSNR